MKRTHWTGERPLLARGFPYESRLCVIESPRGNDVIAFHRRRCFGKLLMGATLSLLVGCAASKPRPTPPTFTGIANDAWLVEDSGPVGRDDVLPAFKVAARNHGCSTEELGNAFGANIQGEYRSYYGISASCDEGTIALITLEGGRVRIGCAKPTTLKACEALLGMISQSR